MTPSKTTTTTRITPNQVHETLSRYMLADGYPVVFDPARSCGADLFDARTQSTYLDLFSFFASQPLGYNHPGLSDPEFQARLLEAATTKPTNSDIYTVAMAEFVQTFAETTVPESHRSRLFFIEGGALAVENAMKAAFDWKYQKNVAAGHPATEDLEILHFENAFHGRSGYTLSVTCTHDPRKYQYFPKFPWPRVPAPACRFPLDDENRTAVEAAEQETLAAIRRMIAERGERIAAILIETIQGEGGDNHFRPEFLQQLRAIADDSDVLLIFDEIQCGMGLTGTWWAFEQMDVVPDIFCFGKKSQVCGIAAGPRLDEVESVFRVSSRINSTWGGNLADMVRCQRYIEIIRDEGLLENAKRVGEHALTKLRELADETGKIRNVRGRGLMIAFDLADTATRDDVVKRLFENKVIILPSGDVSIRFRPVLDFDVAAADRAIEAIGNVLRG